MADTFSQNDRSRIMKLVKSKGNRSTEQKLITFFKTNCIRGWQRNYPVIGKPDFIFLEKRVAIFTDGCFWHGHDCRNTSPAQNKKYWIEKQRKNQQRDAHIDKVFKDRGWLVIRIWECELKQDNLKSIFSNYL